MEKQDLVIVGGGIMGLFTAYFAAQFAKKVVVLEKRTVGNKFSASSGYSRSIRNDYLDPYYSVLASEAQKLWQELEAKSEQKFFIKCGCLNIAKAKVTPNLKQSYARKSYEILESLGFKTDYFANKGNLQNIFPQFEADVGCLDFEAGFLYVPAILNLLKKELAKRGVKIYENWEVTKIKKQNNGILVINKKQKAILAEKIMLAVGVWSIETLSKIEGARLLKLPIIPVPQELDYFAVPKALQARFSAKQMPVFAYLDVGIYGHPLFKDTPGLKVAYFDPIGAKLVKSVFNPQKQSRIQNNLDFIKECLPDLKKTQVVERELNYYDMTPDNDFILDELPGVSNVFIAGGFCGTGFKFAPLVGRVMAEKVFRQNTTVYDVKRFRATRFGRLANLSFLRSLPMYRNFLYPRNWKYLKIGIEALLQLKKMP